MSRTRNPLAPLRAPKPLPAQRSRAALALAARAAEGRFALQVCADCAAVQYPPRDVCGACLGAKLKWRDLAATGTLIAATTTHISSEPYFRERAPGRSGMVALDAGPRALAHLLDDSTPGARVQLALKLDAGGRAALVASAERAVEPDPQGRFGADVAGRNVLIVDGRASTAPALAAALREAGAARVLVGVAESWRETPAVAHEPGVETVALDVTDAGSVTDCAALLGDKVDVLVNNSDRFRAGEADPRWAFEVHALGLARLAAAFGPVLRARAAEEGRRAVAFVNVLSALGLTGSREHAAYAAAHAAARALSQALRAECRPSGLRVVDVLTGPLDDVWRQLVRPPKVAPAALAAALVRALREGVEEVVVGDVAKELHAKWREDPMAARQEV